MVVSNIFYFHPETWGRFPFWRSYCSKGLKPPTRRSLGSFFWIQFLFEFHFWRWWRWFLLKLRHSVVKEENSIIGWVLQSPKLNPSKFCNVFNSVCVHAWNHSHQGPMVWSSNIFSLKEKTHKRRRACSAWTYPESHKKEESISSLVVQAHKKVGDPIVLRWQWR